MNALTTTDFKPLQPRAIDECREPLLILFAGYPEPYSSSKDVDALRRAQVQAYMLALKGLPAWCVHEAVTDFIQGRIERKNRDRLPTAEQVASVARDHLTKEVTRQAGVRERQEQAREAHEWREKQKWLSSPEGQAHQEERARRAKEILDRAGISVRSM